MVALRTRCSRFPINAAVYNTGQGILNSDKTKLRGLGKGNSGNGSYSYRLLVFCLLGISYPPQVMLGYLIYQWSLEEDLNRWEAVIRLQVKYVLVILDSIWTIHLARSKILCSH
ncbi:hypothetical protein S83_010489 [Arachis hypogaea]